MATLAYGGRITADVVHEEIMRLRQLWHQPESEEKGKLLNNILGKENAANLDPFDIATLEATLKVCMESSSMSEAGRKLFAVSRENKKQPNDADRLRKYLAKFGLNWKEIKA
jgi:transcriptional regulatory protein RtcR